MAGRPATLAKKFGMIEAAGDKVFDEVLKLMPEQYHGIQKNPSDPVGLAWKECFTKALELIGAQETLGNLLRKKAGITTPGPGDVVERPPPDEPEPVAAEGAGGGD